MNRRLAIVASVLCTLLSPRAAVAQTGNHGVEALAIAAGFSDAALSDVYGRHLAVSARYVYGRARWSIAGEVGWRHPQGQTREFGFQSDLRIVHVAALARVHLPLGSGPDAAWTLQAGAGILHDRLRERVDFAGEILEASEGATGLLVTGGVRRRLGSSWGLLGEVRYTRLTAPSSAPDVPGTALDGVELGGGVWVRF